MTELKTLREIEDIDKVGAVLPQDLRKEAIKWVKSLRVYPNKIGYRQAERYFDNTINWIKLFFNITDEELSNDKR